MAKSIVVTSDTDLALPVGNATIKGIMLCAGSANATVEVFDGTVAAGVSIGKLAAVTNETAPPLITDIDTKNGVSVDIGGTGAKAFLIYE